MISIPNRITALHDDDLRMRLNKVGVTAHEITDKTRKIYQRFLVRTEKGQSKVGFSIIGFLFLLFTSKRVRN